MSRPVQRVSKAYIRVKKHLERNEARCSRYVGIILAAYTTYKPYKPFPEVLRRFGITPETIESSPLLQLCLEWRNEEDDETGEKLPFFNTLGKGDVLEKLLQEHCPELHDLYPVETTIEKRRTARRKSNRKRVEVA